MGSKEKTRDSNVVSMRRGLDGGMEMSFIPNKKADKDERDEYSGGTTRKDRVERFGAGLEKGDPNEGRQDRRGGRTERRRPGRSASRNTFRRK
jgi:ribosome biogenesis protein ENP2